MIEPIARIRVTLRGTSPEIWRRLDVPLSTSLLSLHHIIQIAMGWKDTHAFRFEYGGKRYGIPDPNAATSDAPGDPCQDRAALDTAEPRS